VEFDDAGGVVSGSSASIITSIKSIEDLMGQWQEMGEAYSRPRLRLVLGPLPVVPQPTFFEKWEVLP
jgi:hypothetical protein